jgi:hypothetical protein
MSLSIEAVDRLFNRLMATYGTDFMRRYDGQDELAVKSIWAHELSGYQADKSASTKETRERMQPIAWALENLPERPPNAIEFRTLCRRMPEPERLRLPEPTPDPARIAAVLEKLAPLREPIAKPADSREWARQHIRRHESGEYRSTPTALQMARNALGLPDHAAA